MGKNHLNGDDIPLGFGMQLMQNAPAMEAFSAMSEEQKQHVLQGARQMRSEQEMKNYVNSFISR